MAENVCYPKVKNIGLRGITVADTMVSMVNGVDGILIYRGYDIRDLAKYCTFEETIHLLVKGTLPKASELAALKEKLAGLRALPEPVLKALSLMPAHAQPMDVLQATVPMLAHWAPQGTDRATLEERALGIVAQMPTAVAAFNRLREGKAPVAPDPGLGHGENFLHMLNGKKSPAKHAHVFDVCLTLHADHTFNASTFAAREVASTRAHMHAAVSAGVGALSGELHGGANAKVMAMLKEIGELSNVESYVNAKLEAGDRIMGMGHAVYKTMDPRAVILKALALEMDAGKYVEMGEAVMAATQKKFKELKGADIYPNVDFFSASVYDAMGIPTDVFTPVFAIGRAAGWCAHVLEEAFGLAQEKPVLYRPKAEYVGDYCGPTGCKLPSIDER